MADIMLGQLLHRPTIDPISESSPLPVQLSGRRIQVRVVNVSSSATVNAGATENIDVMPTTGYRARVLGLLTNIAAPSGAASGNHELYVQIGASLGVALVCIAANYSSIIFYTAGASANAGTTLMPTDVAAFNANLANCIFTPSTPLRLKYVNSTDAAQTVTRTIYIALEEEAIV